jgi:hypothetical protein
VARLQELEQALGVLSSDREFFGQRLDDRGSAHLEPLVRNRRTNGWFGIEGR